MINLILILILSFSSFANSNAKRLSEITSLNRLSFGSCTNQNDKQPLWRDLINQKPDLWIWGGDNVYVDWDRSQDIKTAYDKQNQIPDYVEFKSQVPIIGIWDDHDYGMDNGNGHFPLKDESQKHALDFLEEPLDSPRRTQKGIYTSYNFKSNGHDVKIILLDVRYFKYLETESPMLGKVQWEWFEKELSESKADIHFVVSGTPFLNPTLPRTEEWAETKDFSRLLELLDRTKPKGLVLLSGDKHFSSYYVKYGHLEFMSSGMTHLASKKWRYILRRYFANPVFQLNYGQIDIAWIDDTPVITLSMRTPRFVDVLKKSYIWKDSKWVTY